MAINEIIYLSYEEIIFLHLDQMHLAGESRLGVYERDLIYSALNRPQQAAAYEDADLIRQAATLYFGFIKNHPWFGGNKRTASAIVDAFLMLNGFALAVRKAEVIELVLAIESDRFNIDEIEQWLRSRVVKL